MTEIWPWLLRYIGEIKATFDTYMADVSVEPMRFTDTDTVTMYLYHTDKVNFDQYYQCR